MAGSLRRMVVGGVVAVGISSAFYSAALPQHQSLQGQGSHAQQLEIQRQRAEGDALQDAVNADELRPSEYRDFDGAAAQAARGLLRRP